MMEEEYFITHMLDRLLGAKEYGKRKGNTFLEVGWSQDGGNEQNNISVMFPFKLDESRGEIHEDVLHT